MKIKEFLIGAVAAILMMLAAFSRRKRTQPAPVLEDRVLKDLGEELKQTEVVLERKPAPAQKPDTSLEEAVARFNKED